ncbi:hypothetical protein ACMXYV_11915 [Neptuniibacter sp. SY11_33]|uniref:hypothetical protein n=1 Tax=Neptuniibacter sp. SY11_33 TaxID=3398215 RepID=UPI0039F4AAF8
MRHLISTINSDSPQVALNSNEAASEESYTIESADAVLKLYLDTDEKAPLMAALQQVRNAIIEDLDQVETVAEIYGLMYWLLADHGVDNRGESLEETADRLGDIDIENDTDKYGELIFHLKDAVERLYDIELD